jgi:hypothetical protein
MRRIEEATHLLKHRVLSSNVAVKGRLLRRWFEGGFVRAFAWLATTVYRLTGDWRGWRPLLTRTSAHLAVIAVAIIAIGLSSVEWPAQAALRWGRGKRGDG